MSAYVLSQCRCDASQNKKGPPHMSPLKVFTSIRERRRRSAQQSLEEGAQIMRRLQELLAVPSPTQEVAAPFANERIENDPTDYRESRLRWS